MPVKNLKCTLNDCLHLHHGPWSSYQHLAIRSNATVLFQFLLQFYQERLCFKSSLVQYTNSPKQVHTVLPSAKTLLRRCSGTGCPLADYQPCYGPFIFSRCPARKHMRSSRCQPLLARRSGPGCARANSRACERLKTSSRCPGRKRTRSAGCRWYARFARSCSATGTGSLILRRPTASCERAVAGSPGADGSRAAGRRASCRSLLRRAISASRALLRAAASSWCFFTVGFCGGKPLASLSTGSSHM